MYLLGEVGAQRESVGNQKEPNHAERKRLLFFIPLMGAETK